MFRFVGPAASWKSIDPHITTNPVAPIRPVLKLASRRSAQPVCGMAIAVCMLCFSVRAGMSTSRRHTESTMSWACNYATRRRSGGSRRSCETIESKRRNRTKPGQWTLSTTSLRPARRSGCSQWSIRSRGSRQSSIRDSITAAKTWCACSTRPVPLLATPRLSGSIRAPSLRPETLICGPPEQRRPGLLTAWQADR